MPSKDSERGERNSQLGSFGPSSIFLSDGMMIVVVVQDIGYDDDLYSQA